MSPLALLTMSIALAAGPAAGSGPEIIAHRGESHDAPENTLTAFRLAWDRDVGAIELDVHLTADDRLVCIHDAATKRVCGVNKVVKTSRYDDLKSLDAGSWKGQEFAGERLPLLEEALAAIPPGRRCFIEVKVGPEAVPPLQRVVRDSGLPPDQLVVISFKEATIAEVRRQLPELRAYWLASFKQNERTGEFTPTVDDLIATARKIDAHGINVSYKGPIDAEFVRRVREAGLGLYVWTVDDEREARRLKALGVEGITTNREQWLRGTLAE